MLKELFHVIIVDDGQGKHASCLELPMLYGYGETEAEAREMLEREISSLRDDLKDGGAFSSEWDEYRELLLRMS